MTIVSVPGKIHLMGEHAVVYGKPALLAAINKRMRIVIQKTGSREQKTEIHIKNEKGIVENASKELVEFVEYAIEKVREHVAITDMPVFDITIDSDVPFGYHLGSSAALAVGVVAGVMYELKHIWNPTLFNQIAYEVEKKQHGNPSGGDNTTVTFGGFIWYRKELEFLKSMWELKLSLPKTLNHFFLINTGKPKETTGEMVALVNAKFKSQNATYKKQFDMNEEQTKRVVCAMKENNEKELIDAIKIGEKTLEGMGVVSKKAQRIIRILEKSGGAAKILGGGGVKDGVGFLLCYHTDEEQVKKIAEQYAYSCEKISLGEEGVRLEK